MGPQKLFWSSIRLRLTNVTSGYPPFFLSRKRFSLEICSILKMREKIGKEVA